MMIVKRLYPLLLILASLAPTLLHAAESQTYTIRAEFREVMKMSKKETDELQARYPALSTDAVIYFRECMRLHREDPVRFPLKDAEGLTLGALDYIAKVDHLSFGCIWQSVAPKLHEIMGTTLNEMGVAFSNVYIFIDRMLTNTEIFHDITSDETAWIMIGTSLLEQLSDQELKCLIARTVSDNTYHKSCASFGPQVRYAQEPDADMAAGFFIGFSIIFQLIISMPFTADALSRHDSKRLFQILAGNVILMLAEGRVLSWFAERSRESCYEKDTNIARQLGIQTLISTLAKQTPSKANASPFNPVDNDLARLEFKRLKKDLIKFTAQFPEAGEELSTAIDAVQSAMWATDPGAIHRFFKSLAFTPSVGERILEIKRRSMAKA